MTTVQGISEQQQGSNWVIPTAVGGAAGAGAGYFLSPFAKYSSLDDLVKDAKDVFEGDKAMKEPTEGDAKKAFTDIKKAITDQKATLDKVDELFKDDAKPTVDKVLTEFGMESVKAEDVKLAQELAKLEKGKAVEASDALKKMVTVGEGESLKDKLTALLNAKATVSEEGADGAKKIMVKVTEDKVLTDAKELAAKSNIVEFMEAAAKNEGGKPTQESVKNLVKKDFAEDVKKAFEENKKIFGKNKWFGLAVGLAGGAVVGLLASKFFGSKEA